MNIDGDPDMNHPETGIGKVNHGSVRLRRSRLRVAALAVLGALAITAADAGPRLGTIEECVESGTDLVALPGVPGGLLSARECATCETLRLKFDAKTRYFIGKEAVTYARLLAVARKGTTRIYVFYQPETRALTRLRLEASADAIKQ